VRLRVRGGVNWAGEGEGKTKWSKLGRPIGLFLAKAKAAHQQPADMAASLQCLSHVLQHWMASDSGGLAAQIVAQVSKTPEGKGLCTLLTKLPLTCHLCGAPAPWGLQSSLHIHVVAGLALLATKAGKKGLETR
jgi:hypothetical protein